MTLKPGMDRRVLVGPPVVDHDIQSAARMGPRDLAQEREELLIAVPIGAAFAALPMVTSSVENRVVVPCRTQSKLAAAFPTCASLTRRARQAPEESTIQEALQAFIIQEAG